MIICPVPSNFHINYGYQTVLEVRYVHSLPNTAGALTKTIKTGAKLLQLVQKSQHNLPTGTFVKESTMSSIRTWNELMRIDQQKERSQDEVDERDTDGQMVALGNKKEGEGDNTSKRVLFTSVQTQNSTEQEDGEQRRSQKSRWKSSSRYLLSYLLPSSLKLWRTTENSKTKNIFKCTRRVLETKTRQGIRIF